MGSHEEKYDNLHQQTEHGNRFKDLEPEPVNMPGKSTKMAACS